MPWISELENQEKSGSNQINEEIDLIHENVNNLDSKLNMLYEKMDNGF